MDGPSTAELLLTKVAQNFPDLLEQLQAKGVALDEDDLDEWRMLSTVELPMLELAEDDVDIELGDVADPEDVPDEADPAVYWRGAVRTGQGTSFRTQRPNQFYPLFIDPSLILQYLTRSRWVSRS